MIFVTRKIQEEAKDHRRGRTSLVGIYVGVSLVGGTNVARPTSHLIQA